jgi:hypothetical protein
MKRILFVLVFSLLSFGGVSFAATPEVASDVTSSTSVANNHVTLSLPELDFSKESEVFNFYSCCRSGFVIYPDVTLIVTACGVDCAAAERGLRRAMSKI